ncbi:Efflux pump vrtL [Trichoderma lentiforme]|uniref:Efflux pump vrtL n=1 Tax=Trichoderma lentiforme TaxID=1567552 RepID=A0A9P5C7E8_9HYPO|nr:Efflux pump vrtL [Trichoderma lentiforme]
MEDEKTLEDGHSATSSEKLGARKSNVAGELDDQIFDVETQGHAMRDSSIEGPTKMSGGATDQGPPTRSPHNKTEEKPSSPIIPTSDLDKDIVGWEREDDPTMPLNFKNSQKWLIVCLLSMITFMSPFASSILAPAIIFIEKDLEVSSTTKGAMPVSIFLLGYAVGPLFLSPLSEIYGRNIVLLVSNLWFCLWLIGCALAPTLDTLIFFRFMTGIGGSACQTIGGAVISDLFPVSERGRAMAVWMLGPLFGPSCAPLIGGFVSETIGWRWVNWITFIPAAIIVLISTAINRETNHRVLIKRKTQKLRQELNRPQLRSCYDNPDTPFLPTSQILLDGFVRPMKMLFYSAIIFSISLYIAFAYGCLYLLFNTIPMVFQGSYGWSIGITGLVYLTMLIGYAVGLGIFAVLSDKTVVRMTKANDGVFEPEMRLADCIFFAFVLPISFFWYGWSADRAVHWIVPIIGIIPFGIAIVGIWLPAQAYIIDAYPQHSASGLAAFSVLRCIVAAFLPLAGPQMYESLGVGWGTSLLGFIALALIPIPALIYKFGGRLRQRFPLTL